MEEPSPLNRLVTWVYNLSTSYGHDIKHPAVRQALVAEFYSFLTHPATDKAAFHVEQFQASQTSEMDWTLSGSQAKRTTEDKSARCGHIFDRGEAVYRCRDCGLDDTCVLCVRCFDSDAHAGHNVSYTVHDSNCGCCDCGDSEAWKNDFACPTHAKQHPEKPREAPVTALPTEVLARIIVTFDFMIEMIYHAPEVLHPPRSALHVKKLILPAKPHAPLPKKNEVDRDGSGPWACVLWNDEKHNFAQVIEQVQRAIPTTTKAMATQTAIIVDQHGRDTVLISSDTDALYSAAQIIGSIDLAVTVRPAELSFGEEVAGVFIGFLLDLCASRHKDDPDMLAMAIAQALLAPTSRRKAESPRMPMTRFEQLLCFDVRLWKQARLQLRELYIRLLLLNDDVRAMMGRQYCRMYPNLIDAFLLGDREPDNSIMAFGVQVLSVPSVIARLLEPTDPSERSFIEVLIDILVSFFTEQISEPGPGSRNPRRLLPPSRIIDGVDADSPAFKHKRYFHVLHDLGRLFSSPAAKRALPADPSRIDSLVAFLDLFTNMHTSTRAVGQHVEYESETWITAFNAAIQIGRLAKLCGEAFREAPTHSLHKAMRLVMTSMQSNGVDYSVANPSKSYHMVPWQGRRYRVLRFVVSKEPVSFHHPLQWLYAELAKNVRAMGDDALSEAGFESLGDFVIDREADLERREYLTLGSIEVPIQICALLAQIRAGVWVRNGFTMRIQSLHYREYNLREMTYDQDCYLLQFFMSIFGAELLLIAMLDRFELIEWIQGEAETDKPHPVYSHAHCLSILDDLVGQLVILFGETSIAAGWTDEQRLRKDIVHALAVGQCNLSDLSKRLADGFQDDPAFERTLASVAAYRPPASTNDFGIYSLKPELLDEVDPYYYRYSRNQRDEARKAVLAYLEKKGAPPVIVPSASNITFGVHKDRLVRNLVSPLFIEILFHALRRATEQDSPDQVRFSEAIVDQCVHLVMLAMVNATRSAFVTKATRHGVLTPPGESRRLVEVLVALEVDTRLESMRPKLKWLLDRITEDDPETMRSLRRAPVERPAVTAKEAGKKAAAKLRQQALMQQMATMQQNFMNSELAAALNDEEEEDDDAMDDGGAESMKKSVGDCIVCQEPLDGLKDPFGMLGLIQSSRLLRQTRLLPTDGSETDFDDILADIPSDLDQAAQAPVDRHVSVPKDTPMSTQGGLHASSCGHMMHLRCFEQYCRSVETRHNAQAHRNHPENIDRREYICPLCKSLGNVLLPIDEADPEVAPPDQTLHQTAEWVEDWVEQAAQGWPAHGGRAINRMLAPGGTGELAAWAVDEDLPHPPKRTDDSLLTLSEAERAMHQRIVQVAYSLTAEARPDTSALYLPEELVGYTIKCIEVAQRGQRHDVIDMPIATLRTLRSLFGTLRALADIAAGSVVGSEYASVAVASRVAARDRAGSKFPASCTLALLIGAASVTPSSFSHCATLMFYDELALLLARLILFSDVRQRRDERTMDERSNEMNAERSEQEELETLARFFLGRIGSTPESTIGDLPTYHGPPNLHGSILRQYGKVLHTFALPVLRQIAVVRRLAFDDVSEMTRWQAATAQGGSEYSRLLRYLAIPDPATLLQAGSPLTILHRVDRLIQLFLAPYLSDPTNLVSDRWSLGLPENPSVYRLVALPKRLDNLVADLHKAKCKRCMSTPADPALCLLCGALVCNQTFCCMDTGDEDEPIHGECNTHMWSCGGTIGIYFLVNKPAILYLYADNGSFAPSPYLDEHGEVSNKRNLFKYLHGPRYDEIRRNWLAHSIPVFVARKLDSLVDPGGWTTL